MIRTIAEAPPTSTVTARELVVFTWGRSSDLGSDMPWRQPPFGVWRATHCGVVHARPAYGTVERSRSRYRRSNPHPRGPAAGSPRLRGQHADVVGRAGHHLL